MYVNCPCFEALVGDFVFQAPSRPEPGSGLSGVIKHSDMELEDNHTCVCTQNPDEFIRRVFVCVDLTELTFVFSQPGMLTWWNHDGDHLTKAYNVIIPRYRKSHTK